MADALTSVQIPVAIEDEMRKSYLDYSMSVIIGRALPDVRDGLKPVHRRILYAMLSEGLTHTHRYSKCAGVVGEVLKKYHPHGDAAVYDALVRLAQEWSLRYLLVDGQGNFGSVDGDPPAAYRYTEARLTRLAEFLLADIDKETVDFIDNFDGAVQEPTVLPARFPNLLVNGSSGIAVGMATNIPPHNMGEVIDAGVRLVEKPETSIEELMQLLPGPDFPTAGFIHGKGGIREAYLTGRGHLKVRARATIEVDEKRDREQIVITEIPYQVNKARLVEHIALLVREKRIEGISDIRDESDREGMRVAIDLKKDAIAQIVLNNLFQHTEMEQTFGVVMLAIDRGQPRTMNLKEMLERFIAHRREVVTRRSRYELRKAREREHILTGYKLALEHIDEIVEMIKKAKDRESAREGLMAKWGFSEIQAKAILEMQLQRLTGLERDKILQELAEVQKEIARLLEILGSEKVLMDLVKSELAEVKRDFSDARRTEIVDETEELSAEDLIKDEDMVVTVSHSGYIKRTPASLYRTQRRGGRGRTGAATTEEDFVNDLFVASTHSFVLTFTSQGRVYWLKVHEIPQAGAAARGKAIVNLLRLREDEKPRAIVPVKTFEPDKFIVMVTRNGLVKRTSLDEFSSPRPSGIIALGIEEGDDLVAAALTSGTEDILLGSEGGMAIRFPQEDVRAMGRQAYGVRGMKLEEGDHVVSMDLVRAGTTILTVTENGYGKRTPESEYRAQGRGGMGLIDIKTNERNGKVVLNLQMEEDNQVMIITASGILIRTRVKDISVIGRNTMGVKLIDLAAPTDKVAAVARLPKSADTGEEPEGGPEGGEPETPSPAGSNGVPQA